MNDVVFDQLPVLKDLERVLDEVALRLEQPLGEVNNARLILEQVRCRSLKKSGKFVRFIHCGCT